MGEKEASPPPPINFKACLHEFIGMTLFVYIGCGTAMFSLPTTGGDNAWRVGVAFAFGMAIMVIAYAIAHTSGGQLNWAVTVGLMMGGELDIGQGCANMVSQLLGAILGAFFIWATLPEDYHNKSLGSNSVADGYSDGSAFLGELLMTFLLVFVVFQTAVDEDSITGASAEGRPQLAPLAIGFAVFLAHIVLLPITGCSINPPRSFGPALVATIDGQDKMFEDYWIFFVAPILGGLIAGVLHKMTKASKPAAKTSSVDMEMPSTV